MTDSVVRGRLFWSQFAVLCVIGIVDVYANIHFLYWEYRWLDIPVHFLGGLWVALAVLWLSYVVKRPLLSIAATIALVLFVGVVWEVYEYFFVIIHFDNYVFETGKDLCMDVLGGSAGALVAKLLGHTKVSYE